MLDVRMTCLMLELSLAVGSVSSHVVLTRAFECAHTSLLAFPSSSLQLIPQYTLHLTALP